MEGLLALAVFMRRSLANNYYAALDSIAKLLKTNGAEIKIDAFSLFDRST
jgi:hypothetical protein